MEEVFEVFRNKMRILYGVSGEGFGHSSRAMNIAGYLEKKGHEVIILTYGKGYRVLKKRFKCFKVKGMELKFEKSVLKKRRTVKHNMENFSKNFRKVKRFHKLMREFNPDLCISDMEPIVPILRYWYKKPLISFDNQHRLTNLKFEVPKRYYKDYVIAREVVKSFIKRADYFIITSFAKFPVKKSYKNTFIVPPIIREDVKNLKPKKGKKILVYLTKKDRKVISVLKLLDEEFVVFGYPERKNKFLTLSHQVSNKNKQKPDDNKEKRDGNIEFKTKKDFLKELKDCKAVIATAGFTLMSEAIYLRKPYLALPLKGQFEQTLNALFLKKSGFGDYTEELKEKDVVYFLYKLKDYEEKLKKNKMNYDEVFEVFDRVLRNGPAGS